MSVIFHAFKMYLTSLKYTKLCTILSKVKESSKLVNFRLHIVKYTYALQNESKHFGCLKMVPKIY